MCYLVGVLSAPRFQVTGDVVANNKGIIYVFRLKVWTLAFHYISSMHQQVLFQSAGMQMQCCDTLSQCYYVFRADLQGLACTPFCGHKLAYQGNNIIISCLASRPHHVFTCKRYAVNVTVVAFGGQAKGHMGLFMHHRGSAS